MERNEAIEVVKKNWPDNTFTQLREALETLIPELAESEDERMVVKIARTLSFTAAHNLITDYDELIAMQKWLEKQKELFESGRGLYYYDGEKTIYCGDPATAENPYNFAMSQYEKQKEPHYTKRNALFDKCVENCDPEVMKSVSDEVDEMLEKEQKPIIQDVELNDAVYDYVRDHFIAGADFTPEYIKKLMENAFFAGVDYYLLKQESESRESDTNVEKVIEDVIRVYEKTQGEWVGGYDVDTLIVNLRRAFNKKEQKPVEIDELKIIKKHITEDSLSSEVNKRLKECGWYVTEQKPEWSEEDEKQIAQIERIVKNAGCAKMLQEKIHNWLKSLRPSWKPSEEQMEALKCAIEDVAKFSKRGGRQAWLENEPYYSALHSLYCNLEKLM